MLRFGLPTVPAEVSVFALFFVDRFWLYRFESAGRGRPVLARRSSSPASSSSPCARSSTRGRRSPTRSTTTRRRAASTPASRPTTCCSPASSSPGWRCSAAGWCGCFAAPEFFAAHEALPWVALGWALYGLFLVLVAMAGRAQVTVRNAPAALCGLVVNVVLLALLVAAARDRRRRAGAGRRLRRDARRDVGADPQPVPGRVRVGAAGLLRARRRRDRGRGRAAAADRRAPPASSPARWCWRAIPLALCAARFFRPGELLAARGLCSGARGAFSRRLNSRRPRRRPSPRSREQRRA